MAATLGLGGSAFDLLDQFVAEDPIVKGVKNFASQLFSNPGPNDYASFSFSDFTQISGQASAGKVSLNLNRFTQLSAKFVFGSPQSLSLGSDSFTGCDDPDDLVTFGGAPGSTTSININLVKIVGIGIETTFNNDSLDIGSLSNDFEDPDTDFNLLA